MKNCEMDKYYVSKKTTLTDCCELSISNNIVEKVDLNTVLDIIRKWIKQIFPTSHYIVYCKGSFVKVTVDDITMYDPNIIGDPYTLHVVHAPNNVRFRIGVYKTEYVINKVTK